MEKIHRKLVVIDGKFLVCWMWTGAVDKAGYGEFCAGGRSNRVAAHRWSYQHFVGPIPNGLQLDHFRCWTPACVNPLHLRPSTGMENTHNTRVGNATKTHCKHGHEFTPENTRLIHLVYHTGRP
jgi:hypothetical protein